MPWEETNRMEQKEKFVAEMLKREKPFKKLCVDYGISEKTGYKWKNRFYEEGNHGLYEQSKAPKNNPRALSETTVINIINLKSKHPHWGPKKIEEIYKRTFKNEETPSLSSIKRVLNKAQLVKKKRVRKTSPNNGNRLRKHIPAEKQNDVWAIDFKGWWMSDGEKCLPLTVRDLYSRKIMTIRLLKRADAEAVRDVLTDIFKKYGLPKVIRSDNGVPFASSNGVLSLTCLSAWWITLGILPDRTDKGSPGQNGSLERMHADMAREIEGRVGGGIAENQRVIDEWVKEYNAVRPNEAIDMQTPDELYTPSERKYIGDFDKITYPFGFLTRKAFKTGEIIVGGLRVSISSSLRGLYIGLRPKDNNIYDVFLADFFLGTLDMNFCCFEPLANV
jgi:transposase InsO family protein